VTAEGTAHHNWFDGTNQRNPSADNLRHAHLYNNYLSGVTSYGHYARGGTNARLENIYFLNTKNPITADGGATLTTTGSVFAGSSGQPAANQGTAFKPSDYYQYTLDATVNVPSVVQANAGPRASVCS
jgi:pectate lyase